MSPVVLAALAAGLAAALLPPARERLPATGPPVPAAVEAGWMRRQRPALALLTGASAYLFVGGPAAPVAAVAAAVGAWVALGRAEPPQARRRREAVRRELPHVVTLLATALRAGSAPGEAVDLVCRALPGPAADRLAPAAARLALGVDPATVWSGLGGDAELAPLGRALARAHATGAPVVAAVERLADELAARARAEVEDRARTVGVRAAVPLGLCLLPAFLLVGIVPLVAGLLGELTR
ncbi:type II secretion system protein [Nocardioides sp. zg-579]|uniref:Type II secretion system protein n=2 Tax=Nocardioides marmotae TaxID=2663857 RepID=A0A6I3J3U7_9ACTN|nr:type II secretion system F family protein [Nocardioides marmotae]MCR6029834.1 type II secretion system protein [Gordonia jinghuaiqii]MTB93464.1 type II secretion system protein [Nocardioides marmotae]QKD99847.1 type II secretion system F family protein [Nocardioides marmotae]